MIKKLIFLIPKNEIKKLGYIQILFIFTTIFEITGIISVLPLVYALTSESIDIVYKEYPIIKTFLNLNSIEDLRFVLIGFFIFTLIIYNLFQLIIQKISENVIKTSHDYHFKNILKNYINQNIQFFDNTNSAELLNSLTYNLQLVTQRVLKLLVKTNQKIYSIIIITVSLLYVGFGIASLMLLLVFGLFGLIFFFIKKRIKYWGKITSFSNRKILKNTSELFTNMRVVIIDNLQSYFFKTLNLQNNEWSNSIRKIEVTNLFSKLILETLAFILIIFLLIFYLQTSTNEKALTLISFYIICFYRLMPSIQTIFFALSNYQSWSYLVDKIEEASLKGYNIKSESIDSEIFSFDETLELKDISFSYIDKKILTKVNLKIEKNSIFGISGHTGSGKSTLLDIISNLKKPDSGEVLIDGKHNINLASSYYRNIISYVPQKLFLIDDTIKENILLSRDCDIEFFNKVCEISGVNEFALKLVNGLEFEIGENASKLSNGQKQRIVIARALIKKPQILILDEATSGLESSFEKEILQNINTSFNCTIIVISHRKETLSMCSKIFNLS